MMQFATLPGVSKPVSRLVLGAINFQPSNLEESIELLDAAAERGYTTIDTAHIYNGGGSERALGAWMARRGNRDKVVILTKCSHHNADRKRVTPFDITADLHDSLARLQSDYVDIFLLHRDDASQPVGPIVEVLNEFKAAGKIGIFGGSNWSHVRIAEANAYAEAHGLEGFTASSPNFSLAWQIEEPWPGCITIGGPDNADARQWYVKNKMPVFAYSSLGRGFFSGRLTTANYEQMTAQMDPACVKAYCHEPNRQRLARAEQLAAELGTNVAAIAMAYAVSQPMNLFALVAAANESELDGNLAALDLKLTPEQCAWLEGE